VFIFLSHAHQYLYYSFAYSEGWFQFLFQAVIDHGLRNPTEKSDSRMCEFKVVREMCEEMRTHVVTYEGAQDLIDYMFPPNSYEEPTDMRRDDSKVSLRSPAKLLDKILHFLSHFVANPNFTKLVKSKFSIKFMKKEGSASFHEVPGLYCPCGKCRQAAVLSWDPTIHEDIPTVCKQSLFFTVYTLCIIEFSVIMIVRSVHTCPCVEENGLFVAWPKHMIFEGNLYNTCFLTTVRCHDDYWFVGVTQTIN